MLLPSYALHGPCHRLIIIPLIDFLDSFYAVSAIFQFDADCQIDICFNGGFESTGKE